MAGKKHAKVYGGLDGRDAPAGIEGEELDILRTLRAKRKADLEAAEADEDDDA
ncbi:MAG: hypothetical protein V1708_01745 [Candidatus Micrarchaeota archaeon]